MRISMGVAAATAFLALGACGARSVPADGASILDGAQIDAMLAKRTPACRAVMIEWMQMRHRSRSLWLTASDVEDLDTQTSALGQGGCERIQAQRDHVASLTGHGSADER